jgi:hypothetical protein
MQSLKELRTPGAARRSSALSTLVTGRRAAALARSSSPAARGA